MSNEKPDRVEVGQRWREGVQSVHTPYTVKRERDGRFTVAFDDRTDDDIWYRPEEILRDHFLGWAAGYGPSPGKEGPGMEADENGNPTRCLRCGGGKPSNTSRWCSGCFYRPGMKIAEFHGDCDAWKAGSRDFPRQPALPAPAVPPAKAPGMWTCIRCGGRHPAVEKLCPTRKPKYGRLIGETRAPDGTPLSALQAIACRRSSEDLKPKPPWVPSDLDGDIPDAFPVRR